MTSVLRERQVDAARQQLVKQLYDESRALAAWIEDLDDAVAFRLGLTKTDQRCLEIILQSQIGNERYVMTPGELARRCHLTRGAVTGVLDRLEQAGLIRREHDTRDRRRLFIWPTVQAMSDEFEPILRWLEHSMADVCADYSEEQLRLIVDFSRRLQAHLQIGAERLRRHSLPG